MTQVKTTTQANPSGVPQVKRYPIHAAAILGTIDKKVVQSIMDSMSIRGYVGPPILLLLNEITGNYEIIDGRHRQEAALALGIEPEYEFIDDITETKYPTPDEFVLGTHHMREIRRGTKLLYVAETRPDLNARQQTKMAGGGHDFYSKVLSRAVKERPDLIRDLKNRRKTKMTVVKIARILGEPWPKGMGNYVGVNGLREKFETLESKYEEAKREIRKYVRRIGELEQEVRDLQSDLASAEAEIEALEADGTIQS